MKFRLLVVVVLLFFSVGAFFLLFRQNGASLPQIIKQKIFSSSFSVDASSQDPRISITMGTQSGFQSYLNQVIDGKSITSINKIPVNQIKKIHFVLTNRIQENYLTYDNSRLERTSYGYGYDESTRTLTVLIHFSDSYIQHILDENIQTVEVTVTNHFFRALDAVITLRGSSATGDDMLVAYDDSQLVFSDSQKPFNITAIVAKSQ